MQALAWQQIVTATRLPAVWIATAAHLAALAAYLLIWGDGIPLAGARPAFDQFLTAQSTVLLICLPWIAARCAATLDRESVARLAVRSAQHPSAVVIGGGVGLAGITCAVALTGLPFALASQQISDRTGMDLVASQMRMLAIAGVVGTMTMPAMFAGRGRVAGWLVAAAGTGLAAWAAPAGVAGSLMMAAVGASVLGTAARRAEQAWRYLPERPA